MERESVSKFRRRLLSDGVEDETAPILDEEPGTRRRSSGDSPLSRRSDTVPTASRAASEENEAKSVPSSSAGFFDTFFVELRRGTSVQAEEFSQEQFVASQRVFKLVSVPRRLERVCDINPPPRSRPSPA